MKRRTPRDRRRAGVRVVLGPRDEAILRALARMRLVSTDHLKALFFVSVRRDTAAQRLRLLHDAAFIQARVEGLNRPNLYHLGPEGVRWAQERGLTCGRPPAGSAAHHLALVEAWTRLAATLRTHPRLRLARFEPDWELRSRLAEAAPTVIPDATLELQEHEGIGRHRFVLEVDLTTERPETLRRKLFSYDSTQYFDRGVPVGLLVVLVGAGPRRVAAVRELVCCGWSGSSSAVLLDREWPEAFLETFTPPLTASPNREGGLPAANLPAGLFPRGQGEGPSR